MRYNNLRVAIYGDHILDHSIMCHFKRKSTEAPVDILTQNQILNSLGGATNVAANVANLGAQTAVFGVLGLDEPGKKILKLCSNHYITSDYLILSKHRQTSVKTRIFKENKQVVRYDKEDIYPIHPKYEPRIIENIKTYKPDILIVVDYNKGAITPSIMHQFKTLDIPIYVNGKPENIDCYKDIKGLICNEQEYQEASIHTQNKSLIEYLNCDFIINTQGKKGLFVLTHKKLTFIKAHQVKEVDPTGASDTVISIIALETQYSSIEEAARVANKAASLIVTKTGTVPVDLIEVEEYISNK